MPATVIVDVFSGIPNPQWTIAGDVLMQLQLMLAQLQQFHGGFMPEPPALGFRGIIVQFSPGEALEGHIRVFNGYVVTPRGTFVDAGRALERWLLQTGIPHGYGDLIKDLLREVR